MQSPEVRWSTTVAALAAARETLPETVPTSAIDLRFRESAELRSIVISGADGTHRLLNRTAFYQALVGRRGFGYALYHRKPVARLPVGDRLVLDGRTPALVAAGSIVDRGGLSTSDDVLVDLDGQVGTVQVGALLAEVARDHEVRASRLDSMLQHLSDVVAVVGTDTTLHYLSASFAAITGRPAEGHVGRSLLGLLPAAEHDEARRLLRRASEQPGRTVGTELHVPTGETAIAFDVVAQDLCADPSIGGYLLTWRDVTERRRLEAELRHRALHDPLTGLANRRLLLDRIQSHLATPGAAPISVAWVDLDGFKAINDTCGHATGDAVLRAVADRMCAHLRPTDLVARIGGDEFAIMLDGSNGPEDAVAVLHRVHAVLAEPLQVGDRVFATRASAGLVTGDGVDGADELLHRADVAMYAAKAQGKARVVVWDEALEDAAQSEQGLMLELEVGLCAGQFEVHYQPIVRVATGQMTVVEALARWHHPERGLVPPNVFIPLAERSGAITPLTRWVLAQACAQARAWEDDGTHGAMVVAVNLSAMELSRPGLVEDVARVLSSAGLAASRLELEVTETSIISNMEAAYSTLRRLRQLGVRIAIDDFGTGYSSLSYLHDLPVDRIKIDKSFVDRIVDAQGEEIVRGLIRLAHSLGLAVTAEGVEQRLQHDVLAALGCDEAQGYFFARPTPAHQLTAPGAAPPPGPASPLVPGALAPAP